MKKEIRKIKLTTTPKTDTKPVLADSKKFIRCLDCEWIACENHGKCSRYKIR